VFKKISVIMFVLLFVVLPANARGLNKEQFATMRLITQSMVLAVMCDVLKSDIYISAKMALAVEMPAQDFIPSGSKYHSDYKKITAESFKKIAAAEKNTPNFACIVGLSLFGPNGSVAPGLLKPV